MSLATILFSVHRRRYDQPHVHLTCSRPRSPHLRSTDISHAFACNATRSLSLLCAMEGFVVRPMCSTQRSLVPRCGISDLRVRTRVHPGSRLDHSGSNTPSTEVVPTVPLKVIVSRASVVATAHPVRYSCYYDGPTVSDRESCLGGRDWLRLPPGY